MTLAAAVTAAGLLLAASSPSWGQPGHGAGHEAGQQAGRGCAEEFDKVVGRGLGFGMAFAADRFLEAEAKLRRLFAQRTVDGSPSR